MFIRWTSFHSRQRKYEYPWQSENMATLKAFEGIFNIRVCDWRYDGCTCYYRFTSNYSEEEEGLCGVRLLKFIRGRTLRCAVIEIHREQLLAQPFQAQDLLARKGLQQTTQKPHIRNRGLRADRLLC